jgi:hypothetical protein
MKKYVMLFSFVIMGIMIFTAQKYQDDPRWNGPALRVWVPSGNYTPYLPVYRDVIVNTAPRIVKTPSGTMVVNPNFRPFPHTATQSEVEAFTNSNMPGVMIAGWNSYSPSFYGTGFAVSTNSGANWSGNYQLTPAGVNGGDPSVAVNSTGNLFMNALGYSYTTVITSKSTDFGSTWGTYVTVASSSSEDKNHVFLDDKSASPYFNNLYCSWTDFASSTWPAKFARSTDANTTWTNLQQITTPLSGHYSQGVNINTGPNGEVYFTCATNITSSPYTEDYLCFARSTNGGVNFSYVNEQAIDVNGIRGYLKTTNIRVNSFPWMAVDRTGGSRNGYIYLVWAQRNLAPAGSDPDICLSRSTNNGTNWSTPVRVNDDPLNNGRDQWFPNVNVDPSGGINIVFYDSRNPTTNDSAEVYLARSTDGGSTFVNTLISDHRFKPKPISGLAGGYQGDYIGITSGNGYIWPFWADDYSGIYQVWTTSISYGPPPPPPAHDIVMGPFLSLPSQFVINTAYSIKTKITNGGTSNETNVPIRFFVGTNLVNTTNINLNASQVDSVSNTWTPTSAGSYILTYAAGLANDTNRFNDTARVTVQVLPGPLQTVFCDDFTSGSGNWTITNNGGVCIWSVRPLSSRPYTLPSTAQGNVFSADVDACGSGTSINSTATLTNALNCSNISDAYVEFDNDFYILGADQSKLDVSTDGGTTWINKFTWTTNHRSTHETVQLPEASQKPNVKIRLVSIQPSWDWWWAVDNVCVKGYLITGAAENQNNIPKEFALAQNYPNPFNPTTVISYELPKASSVRLVIYDMLGREVKTLVNDFKQAGSYNVSFDASSLASGVYFYRINAGDFTAVKKMMLIK